MHGASVSQAELQKGYKQGDRGFFKIQDNSSNLKRYLNARAFLEREFEFFRFKRRKSENLCLTLQTKKAVMLNPIQHLTSWTLWSFG
jgi:hypothetical protein